MLELFVEAGPQSGQRFALESNTVLGRGQFADLVIADLAVSRRHAQIEHEGTQWLLRDLESANGTRHNGKVLLAPVRLDDGDSVELGQTRLRVRLRATGSHALPLPPLAPAEATMMEPAAAQASAPMSPPPPPPPTPPGYQTSPPGEMKPFVPGIERRREVVGRLLFFKHAAELLAHAGELEHQLRDALTALADVFPRCRRALVLTREAAHRPWVVVAQRLPAGSEIDLGMVQAMASAAVNSGRVLIAGHDLPLPPTVSESLTSRLPASLAVVGLVSAGNLLGALYLDSEDDADAVAARDAEFLLSCAGQFAALIALCRRTQSERLLQPDELALARRVQARYLPTATPRFEGYEIGDYYRPAQSVGGDLFDFLALADGRPLLFLGDVSGKGMPAALVMARVGAQLRVLAPRARNVVELMHQLDATIRPELENGMFVTAAVAAIDVQRGDVELVTAGHPMPLLRRADGRIDELPAMSSSALGIGQKGFHDTRVELARGDGLLFYTDGLDEARDASEQPLGLARIKSALATARSAGQAIEVLSSTVDLHIGTLGAHDDLSMIALWRR
jgi:serine phosphatase RsbU (regulator of sigma subunit)